MRTKNEETLRLVYNYIVKCHSEESRSPTQREISSALHINSMAWVTSLIDELGKCGKITFEYSGKRRVIAVPDKFKRKDVRPASVIGTCPCGEPILAVENIEYTVLLPTEIFGDEEHFILTAKGRSMINRGIFDGDLMVVKVQNCANVGDVVIARINNEEATAKVLARKNGKYYLRPANDETDEKGKPLYRDIHPKGDWDILGIVDYVIHSTKEDVSFG